MTHLESFVKAQVQESIEEKFKDQKLVDIDTSQAIAERLHGWAKMFGFFVALPFTALLIVISVAGIEKYSDFKKLVDSVDLQVKPKIEQAKVDSEQAQRAAKEAKNEAEDSKKTIEVATTEAKRQLGSATELAKSVKGLSDRVSGLEQQTSNQMKSSSQRVDARVSELDEKIDEATQDIAVQQKKLASTDELVKTLFSKGTTEVFLPNANTTNVVTVSYPTGALVFMLLKSAPIYQTTELKWHVFSEPHGSFWTSNNVLIFRWGESAANLMQHQIEITYVPDPTSKTPAFKALSMKGNAVFADETKLMDLPK